MDRNFRRGVFRLGARNMGFMTDGLGLRDLGMATVGLTDSGIGTFRDMSLGIFLIFGLVPVLMT